MVLICPWIGSIVAEKFYMEKVCVWLTDKSEKCLFFSEFWHWMIECWKKYYLNIPFFLLDRCCATWRCQIDNRWCQTYGCFFFEKRIDNHKEKIICTFIYILCWQWSALSSNLFFSVSLFLTVVKSLSFLRNHSKLILDDCVRLYARDYLAILDQVGQVLPEATPTVTLLKSDLWDFQSHNGLKFS